MTAPASSLLDVARRWMTDGVRRLFEIELANEDAMCREAMSKGRMDEMPPATSLSTVIDSLAQGLPLDNVPDPTRTLVQLLMIRDLLPGNTDVRDLL